MRARRLRFPGSFTLIELLVVVGIIAILAGLLLPALTSVRERGRRIQCINNLRQIGIAIKEYSADFGAYPEGNNNTSVFAHMRLLSNNLGNIGLTFKCASDRAKTTNSDMTLMTDNNVSYLYVRGLNDEMNICTPVVGDRHIMDAPSSTVVSDGIGVAALGGPWVWTATSPHKQDGGNYLCVGGQVLFRTRIAVPQDLGSATIANLVVTPD